jgi:hypothetical protein
VLVRSLVFAALVASLAPQQARAQSPASGKFTLPIEVHWGSATLPKGDYSFTMREVGATEMLIVSEEGKPSRSYMISAVGWDLLAGPSPSNKLIIAQAGGEPYVEDLQLGCVGTVLHFGAPSRKEKLLAKGSPPARQPEPMPSEM